MKTITRTINLYSFEELDKETQNVVINNLCLPFISKIPFVRRNVQTILDNIRKEVHQNVKNYWFFKDGTIADIKENS